MNFRHQYMAFYTILFKEVQRFVRIWPQTLVPPAISMALYFVVFGSVIGTRIGTMANFSYVQYVVPGLIMMSVITNSFGNVASSFFGEKYQHSIEELLVSPVGDHTIIWGYVLGSVLRGLAVGVIVTGLSLFFTHLSIHNMAITLLAVLLTAILFALAGLINAIYAKRFDDVSIIPTFLLAPLTYLGGVFYSINVLPEIWQHISLINPIFYMVNTFRYGILGYSDGVHIGVALLVIMGFIVSLYGFALYSLRYSKGLRQ